VLYEGRRAGVVGEVHPAVLENWGIQVPAAAGEIELDVLLENERNEDEGR
jgi:phenylalanyl-tRNA synthetase beta chain